MMKKLAAEQAAEQAAQMNAEKLDDAALQLFDKPGLCSQYPVGADSHFRVHTVLEKYFFSATFGCELLIV